MTSPTTWAKIWGLEKRPIGHFHLQRSIEDAKWRAVVTIN